MISGKMYRMRVDERLAVPQFVEAFLRSPATQRVIDGMKTGISESGVNLTHARFAGLEVSLPPLPEQRRIVSKIEELQARSRRAREALDVIPPLLAKFRQSVLAAAFRGDLTVNWRARNPDVEAASVLLERIRTERRRQWEAAELARMRARGKEPRDDRWKQKYEEPAPVDASELPGLPEGWKWASVELLTSVVTSGSRGWAEYYSPTGAVFLRVGNLDRHTIELDLSDVARVTPPESAEAIRTAVAPGDVLMSITADVGMVAVVPEALDQAYINQHVALLRPVVSVQWVGRRRGAGEPARWASMARVR
jgi:type I restriction enzyme S subunit